MIHTLLTTFGPDDPARRRWLTQAAFGAVALGAATTPSAEAGKHADAAIDEGFVHFADARERFRALFRLERDLRDEGTALSSYQFLVYALPGGERPQPVVRYEGMEFSYFRRIGPDTWRIHAHNVSFPRDIATGEFVTRIPNPFGSAPLDVPPMKLLGDPGVLHGPRGYLPLDAPRVRWLDTHFVLRIEGELLKAEHIRPTPDGWPRQFIESSISTITRRDFDDPRVTSLPYQSSGFYVFPFPKWMNMENREGHMLGAWSGRKLRHVDQLPRTFAARLARENPELLQPRWQEFERSIPKEIATWTEG